MKTQRVTAAIINKDDKVLLARRAPEENHAGYWEFPGGKVEAGETAEGCLQRELHEELGIETRINSFYTESQYEYPAGKVQLLAFLVEITRGEIQLRVHDRFAWVAPIDLLEYSLLPADIEIAKMIKGEQR
jgi:8-oxo-dGTP diphosphatase